MTNDPMTKPGRFGYWTLVIDSSFGFRPSSFPLEAVAGAFENDRVHAVGDERDGTVAVEHVDAARVGAAEPKRVAEPLLVLQGRRVGVTRDVVVHADVHALV